MKFTVDMELKTVHFEDQNRPPLDLYSDQAFQLISQLWLKLSWNQKYHYSFSWMGQPIVQVPEDMVRFQEWIYQLKPDVILETGIAHGGSLLFSATLCKALGKGRVIGVDIVIRPPTRKSLENHFLASFITLVEGNSVDPQTISKVKSLISPNETVLVILDSNHSKEHVLKELEAYHNLVSSGSLIIIADGFMKEVADTPRGRMEWEWDNPSDALDQFLSHHSEFVRVKDGSQITHWMEIKRK